MRFIDRINQFLVLFLDTLRQFGNWRAWGLLIGFFLLNWLLLYAHREFVHAPFFGILQPWVSLFGEDRARAFTHYPQSYFLLPDLFGWAKLVLGVLLEALVLGLVARLLHRFYAVGENSGNGRSVVSLWGHLLIVWLFMNGLNFAVGAVLPSLAEPYINGPRRLMAFSFVVMPFVFTLLFSLFMYAIPSVVMFGENAGRGLLRSLKIFLKRPFMSFFLAAAILALPLLLGSILNQPINIVDRFRPELIYWLLVVSLGVEMIANFFWMGTTVRFLIEPGEE